MAHSGTRLPLATETPQGWKEFKQKFHIRVLASGFKSKSDEEKVALLLETGGDPILDLYNSFEFPAPTDNVDPAQVLATVLAKFDEHFGQAKDNELDARHMFRRCQQDHLEFLDAWITRLKIHVKDCNFGDQKDKMLRDQIVFCCREEALREKLYREEDLTLEKTLNICTSHVSSKRQLESFRQATHDAEVRVHRVKERYSRNSEARGSTRADKGKYTAQKNIDAVGGPKKLRKCKFCGQKHLWKKGLCPAIGKKCATCGRLNHFAVVCRQKGVHAVQEDTDNSSGSEIEIVHNVTGKKEKKGVVMATFHVGNRLVKFMADSGCNVNIMPRHLLGDVKMEEAITLLSMWNNTTLTPLGKCRTVIRNRANRKRYNVEFIVVEESLTPLLGLSASTQMGLITVNHDNICGVSDILAAYSDVFTNEVGRLPGVVHLRTDKSVTPMAISSCRVPVSMKEKLKCKLKDMEKAKVIVKVDKPTEWVSRMVAATKGNGDLRVCIDPQALNRTLMRERHPLLVIDDILPEISKARVFSKMDLKNAFWHCVLDEESSYLTTFQTPFGRYRWRRLPFGLAVSSEIFAKRLLTALDGLEGVVCVADDILVYGVGEEEQQALNDHDNKLVSVLERCRLHGIRLNKEKTQLRATETAFLGHRITKDGLKADPAKIEAMQCMPAPTDVTGVQRLNGMVNYLSRFLPRLSQVMEPIRRLTIKGVDWIWGPEQRTAFKAMKQLITSTPILAYYDTHKPLEIQCDASKDGLGAVLMQEQKPIMYASRALTETERRYAQIEKEMLSIVFSLMKFHQYTFGRRTTVITDHKPLLSISKKPLDQAPRRLQGMLVKTQTYDINLEFRPRKEMHIADQLSRAFLPTNEGGEMFEAINMMSYLPIRQERIDKLKEATMGDEVLTTLAEVILCGWPEERNKIPPAAMAYFHSRDEFAVQDGLIFKGQRIVIPLSMRPEIKKAIHSSHLGVESCLRRAQECVYWPGMNAELRQFISTCEPCNRYQISNQKETLMNHEIPDRPWERVAVDLMELKGQDYLVTVDYFSNYWEVDHLQSTTAKSVIRILKGHFARHGIPSSLISDNGPQFNSSEFSAFAEKWDFEHRTSSPGNPRANGMAESAVKTAKRLLKKAVDSGSDPYLAILDYRNTPSQGTETSPAQRLFGRRTRNLLPMTAKLLEPQRVDVGVESRRKRLRRRQGEDKTNGSRQECMGKRSH